MRLVDKFVEWGDAFIELFVARYSNVTYREFFDAFPEMLDKNFVCPFCTVTRTMVVTTIFWIIVGSIWRLILA